MGKKRLTVRKIREILRLHFTAGLSNRQISENLKISKTTVQDCKDRFQRAGLSWPLSGDITDDVLHGKLYPGVVIRNGKPQPDWVAVHLEMKRRHVTLQLLWEEYRDTYPDGMGRSQFYEHYSKFCGSQEEPVMRMVHKGGEKLYIDFSGDGLHYVDRTTGEIIPVALFVASWAASSYSFAEAAMDHSLPRWLMLHRHMYRFFGCVPALSIPDNEKAGVTKASKYEPVLQPTYALLGEHYNTVILPTRPASPRDKATVESNVLHIQRYILGRLRNRVFFSLAEVNEAIKEELADFNARPMQLYKVSRLQRFEELDKPYARPLPAEDFPYVNIQINIRVAKDYHIEYDKFFYSVPHALCGELVEVRRTNQVVEIFHNRERVASHPVGVGLYHQHTTTEHMPANHQFVKGWSPGYFLNRALSVGPHTVELFKAVMARSRHPEQSYRKLMGILNLRGKYSKERIEKAAERALFYRHPSLKALQSILETGIDKEPLALSAAPANIQHLIIPHENIRGADYYAGVAQEQEVRACC
jgi:transposase